MIHKIFKLLCNKEIMELYSDIIKIKLNGGGDEGGGGTPHG